MDDMKHILFSCLLALPVLASPAWAGAPDKLARPAGAQPSESQARAAVIDAVQSRSSSAANASRVRFLSGPRLVTGTNFANGREQAWLMCVVEGDAAPRRGPMDLELKSYLLRNDDHGLAVVQLSNWKDSEARC